MPGLVSDLKTVLQNNRSQNSDAFKQPLQISGEIEYFISEGESRACARVSKVDDSSDEASGVELEDEIFQLYLRKIKASGRSK